jgi:hypothetical protein
MTGPIDVQVTPMPWHVEYANAGCSPTEWAVISDADGTVAEGGCHPSRADAEQHMAALYANTPDAQVEAVTAAAGEVGGEAMTGAMVAFIPASRDAMRMVIDGGEDLSQLHATALYLGDAAAITPETRSMIIDRVRQFAMAVGPITAMANGVAELNPGGPNPCLVLILNGQGLAQAEAMLCADAELMGAMSQEQHCPWLAHITLIHGAEPFMYEPEAAAALGPVTFDRVRVAFAGEATDIPLSGPAPSVADLVPAQPKTLPDPAEAEMEAEADGVSIDLEDDGLESALTAAGWTIAMDDLPPESFFDEPDPAELPPFGSLSITADGRVIGLIAPKQVVHRAFRASGNPVTVPTGQDYTEFNNKPVLVAGADGEVAQIYVGNLTASCGHVSPYDPMRAAGPAAVTEHYDNSCSIIARVRAGEHSMTGQPYIVGSLMQGSTAADIARLMGTVVSGDWQQGKFNAALAVPVEGFPRAVPEGARLVVGNGQAVVASVRYQKPAADLDDLARTIGMDAGSRLDELARTIGE